ncbi:MSP (Major sperm protein) domain-containing protein [Ditylenchus destructor]|uniref:MSP (Major sperm protein) domain-containing protein n=1 Tax=Ditylenchus destructor TaxID=166010 RepID=A0AAD4N029_9BILA|nr:MSP (Major sperm protein) domain-containing protein [Ditylenchus destructor]
MSYYESRSRARGNDEDEGLDYMTASGSTSSFPVFLQPAELHFILSKPDTHKQVLTVYNPYEFGIRFTVLSNAPSRYRVVEPRGFIRPKCYVDIMIRHLSPTLAAMVNNDCLRIEIFREGDASPCGRKDVVMNVLAADAKHNIEQDEFKAFPGPGTGAGTSRQISARGQRQQVAFAGNPPPQAHVHNFHWLVVFGFFTCIITLLLPAYHSPLSTNMSPAQTKTSDVTKTDHSPAKALQGAEGVVSTPENGIASIIPMYIRPSPTLQLVAAYVLGLLTVYLIQPNM